MKKLIIAIASVAILATIILTMIYLYSNYQSSEVPDAGGNTEGG